MGCVMMSRAFIGYPCPQATGALLHREYCVCMREQRRPRKAQGPSNNCVTTP